MVTGWPVVRSGWLAWQHEPGRSGGSLGGGAAHRAPRLMKAPAAVHPAARRVENGGHPPPVPLRGTPSVAAATEGCGPYPSKDKART